MLTDTHRTQIIVLVQDQLEDPNAEITDSLRLCDDLGFDSIDAIELAVQIECWLSDLCGAPIDIPNEEREHWVTVGDIMTTLEKLL